MKGKQCNKALFELDLPHAELSSGAVSKSRRSASPGHVVRVHQEQDGQEQRAQRGGPAAPPHPSQLGLGLRGSRTTDDGTAVFTRIDHPARP